MKIITGYTNENVIIFFEPHRYIAIITCTLVTASDMYSSKYGIQPSTKLTKLSNIFYFLPLTNSIKPLNTSSLKTTPDTLFS